MDLLQAMTRCQYCNHFIFNDVMEFHRTNCCNVCTENLIKTVLKDILDTTEYEIEQKIETYTGDHPKIIEIEKEALKEVEEYTDLFIEQSDIPDIVDSEERGSTSWLRGIMSWLYNLRFWG